MSSANSLKVGETKNVEAKTQTSKSQKSGRRKKKNQKVTVDQHLMVYAPIEALDDLPIGMPESKVTEPPNFILPVMTDVEKKVVAIIVKFAEPIVRHMMFSCGTALERNTEYYR